MAGLAYTYHFSQGYGGVGIFAGAAGKGWSAGASYDLTSGTASGWTSISIGKILSAIATSDSGRYMQVANAGYFSDAEAVTGKEDRPNGPMGEKTWYMEALDRLGGLHPLSVTHDHWVTQRGVSGGGEFWASMVPSAFIGRGMAGPVRTNPYGFQMDAERNGYIW
jgi:hypothetical protein